MPESDVEQHFKLEILERRKLTAEAVRLRLGSPDGPELPGWDAA
jgi:hypothetical protein